MYIYIHRGVQYTKVKFKFHLVWDYSEISSIKIQNATDDQVKHLLYAKFHEIRIHS